MTKYESYNIHKVKQNQRTDKQKIVMPPYYRTIGIITRGAHECITKIY